MNYKIKNILLKLEEHGYKAYIVGGFVRDYLLGIESYDVDISTNALPKEIKEIFDLSNSNDDNYGSVHFKDSLYNYDITTFRHEIKYQNRRPLEFEYVNDIETDILRRDFTINAIYMDAEGEIFDLVNGREDLENKVIRSIGNISTKMSEDPLRMLRAIRFSTILDYKIEDNLYNFIRQNKISLRTLSNTRKKEELDHIFKSNNKLLGIELLKKIDILDEIGLKIPEKVTYCKDYLGIWAQIDFSEDYAFKRSDLEHIENIRKVIKYGIIDNIVLYECGLYVCIIAGEILGIPSASISDIYKHMPIYSLKDVKIDGDDIKRILNISEGTIIKEILFDLEINILNGNINNDQEELEKYIIKNWR